MGSPTVCARNTPSRIQPSPSQTSTQDPYLNTWNTCQDAIPNCQEVVLWLLPQNWDLHYRSHRTYSLHRDFCFFHCGFFSYNNFIHDSNHTTICHCRWDHSRSDDLSHCGVLTSHSWSQERKTWLPDSMDCCHCHLIYIEHHLVLLNDDGRTMDYCHR